ncbi:MAG: hypothetical protein Q8P83_04145 [bacterium]|nr:hypothetical protein [bacterium]
MKIFNLVALFVFMDVPLQAQDIQSIQPQIRLIIHPTVPLQNQDQEQYWFATSWLIGNAKSGAPENLNLFLGIRYKHPSWWLESMVQHQWSPSPGHNSWHLDFRLFKQFSERIGLYAETAPALGKKILYDFIFLEARAIGPLAFGVETENVHKPGPDSLGAGPLLSYPLATFGNHKLVSVLSYQFRRGESNVARLYMIMHLNLGVDP